MSPSVSTKSWTAPRRRTSQYGLELGAKPERFVARRESNRGTRKRHAHRLRASALSLRLHAAHRVGMTIQRALTSDGLGKTAVTAF
jgi:hypothetical protein